MSHMTATSARSLIAMLFIATGMKLCDAWLSTCAPPCLAALRGSLVPRTARSIPMSSRTFRVATWLRMSDDEDHVETSQFDISDVKEKFKAEMDCWRPDIDDVDRISWGKPAKKKTTGSRGVPHRLNEDERILYDMARRKGFIEVAGSGWRKQRRGAPLANTYRNWCDARAIPVISLYKDKTGYDEVVLDLSPLRVPDHFLDIATFCANSLPGAKMEALEEDEETGTYGIPEDKADLVEEREKFLRENLKSAYANDPIYRLPMYVVSWIVQRNEAKELAKKLAGAFETAEVEKEEEELG
mmetsp:Transcript_24030/g.78177  ORF Transcript_24030/g.78177 Transcript_24030/m.78177 type:complete len:299 (-) Transcript_24030:898-1794(-)